MSNCMLYCFLASGGEPEKLRQYGTQKRRTLCQQTFSLVESPPHQCLEWDISLVVKMLDACEWVETRHTTTNELQLRVSIQSI